MSQTNHKNLNGKEVFDLLMEQIEPELTSKRVMMITQRSLSETAAQKNARHERYKRAFAEYDRRERKFLNALHNDANIVKREVHKKAEHAEQLSEKMLLNDLESTFNSTPIFLDFLLNSNV